MFLHKMLSRICFNGRPCRRFIKRLPYIERSKIDLWDRIKANKIESFEDWKHVRTEILKMQGPVTPASVDSITVATCTNHKAYNLALSYLEFLEKEKIKLNLATIGKYFKLLYLKGVDEQFCENDEKKVLALYDEVKKSYPVLDSLTLDNLIQALSLTNKWKLCLTHLEEMKISSLPSSAAYCSVVAAAFLKNEDILAWTLLDELIKNNKTVLNVVYSTYFNKIANSSTREKDFDRMFIFMQKNGIKVDSASLEDLVHCLKMLNVKVFKFSVNRTKNICNHCNKRLEKFELSEDEFSELRSKILENVIVGKDVFNKSTPEELQDFQNFVSKQEKFDVVIDGLNVAYSSGAKRPPSVTSALVSTVVSHFVKQRKKVLLLGRKHMQKWPTKTWSYICQNASVFLTQNISQDDPYLLYCALNSGKDTIIVSRDLMRGHKFLLKDQKLKTLFDIWLTQRQYFLVTARTEDSPIFKKPPFFSHVAQKTDGYWHLPLTATHPEQTSFGWLCIKTGKD